MSPSVDTSPVAKGGECREREADDFYAALAPPDASEERQEIMRRAFAGMIWCKQFFRYDVSRWLDGDPTEPPPPPGHALSAGHPPTTPR